MVCFSICTHTLARTHTDHEFKNSTKLIEMNVETAQYVMSSYEGPKKK